VPCRWWHVGRLGDTLGIGRPRVPTLTRHRGALGRAVSLSWLWRNLLYNCLALNGRSSQRLMGGVVPTAWPDNLRHQSQIY
jgi:hypothetical protein